MRVKELIKELQKFDDDRVVLITFDSGYGWAKIREVILAKDNINGSRRSWDEYGREVVLIEGDDH